MQNRIKDMDIKAWIPGSSGQGPKFPVPDECRSGVLYLKYKELDIFIPGKALIGSRNDRLDTYENKNTENCKFNNISAHLQTRCDVADSENVVEKIGGGNSEIQKYSAGPLKRSVAVQWSVDDTEVTTNPIKPNNLLQRSVETHLSRTENKKLTRKLMRLNRHTKYIVIKRNVTVSFPNNNDVVDKPCNDVCKSNVSVSDDTGKMFGRGDCGGVSPTEAVLTPGPKRGFVKRLIEYYNSMSATSANKQ